VIKKLRYLRKFDPNRDANSNWREADPLHFAWLVYGPAELQERYRNSGSSPAASKALELELQFEVRAQIAAGKILAFGVRILPDLRDKAEQIPEILFQSADAKIDWEGDQIAGLGRQFNDVRICLSADSGTVSSQTIADASPLKRGRKSHSDILEEAFTQLELEHDHFSDWVSEKQMHEIQTRTAALHPGRFRGGKPGRSTVYRFLSERRGKRSVP
jgi:hypothetical protein